MTYTKEDASDKVKGLVDQFADELDELKSGVHVKEAQIEDKYIKPLWGALNWNVSGKGQIHRRQEFVVQGTIRSRKGTFVEPDYILRLPDSKGRMRDKLYIEAKLPKYPLIEMETTEVLKYVRQAYRYAHMKTAQSEDVDKWVRLSILTDFEEFLLFDCVDSAPLEKGNEHLLKKAIVEPFPWTFDRYVTDFDFLWDTFERNHVAEGSLEKLKVTPQDRIKKRLPPDDRFLEDIKRWRLELAKSMWRLNRKNLNFNDDLLSTATQLIIDRLVFVKMLSDKGIEPDYLSQMLSDLGKLGDSNVALFQECKSRFSFLNTLYNGTIFSERAELDAMPVENKVLIEILKELDPEYAPYTLASLDVRIIGNAYEQYLGEVIHSDGRCVRVEKKPEVIKANGVYYTPGYIVEYIVENTLGELLKNCKSLDDVSKLKILDPACGSGSFLLTAYDFILRWYQDYFVKERKVEKKYREFAEIIKLPDGGEVVRLTAKLRRDILLNNIYGVDIDPQAVEVAQFSLCMKALEGVEDRKELETERNLFKQAILPNLNNNIKCGNSLIGNDYSVIPTERISVKTFDWDSEFPNIMNNSRFDAVIGNPPYLYSAGRKYADYMKRSYKLSEYQTDYYVYFMERAFSLVREGGCLSFIVSDSWINSERVSKIRTYLLEKHNIAGLTVFDYPVFEKATLENSIVNIIVNGKPKPFPINCFHDPQHEEVINTIDPSRAVSRGIIDPRSSGSADNVIAKIEDNSNPLGSFVLLNRGIHAYRTDGYGKSKYGPGTQTQKDKENKSYHAGNKLNDTYLPEVKGKDVFRFCVVPSGSHLSYGNWLAEPRDRKYIYNRKIVLRKILGEKLSGTYIPEPMAVDQSLYIGISQNDDTDYLLFTLGVLMSGIGAWYLRTKYSIYDKLYPWYTKKQLAKFPMKNKDVNTIKAVKDMLQMQNLKTLSHSQTEIDQLQRQIELIDRQLDKKVYELYGLTDDEIKIVEGN